MYNDGSSLGLLWALFLLAVVFIIINFTNTNNLTKRHAELVQKLNNILGDLMNRKSGTGITIEMQQTLQNNKADIEFLTNKVMELEKALYAAGSRIQAPPVPSPQPTGNGATLYFSTPDPGGFFVADYATSTVNEGASMYLLQKTSATTAEVYTLETANAAQLLLASPRNNIEPACMSMSNYNPNARLIKTLIPGKAELLSNGRWMIVHKVTIRAESGNEGDAAVVVEKKVVPPVVEEKVSEPAIKVKKGTTLYFPAPEPQGHFKLRYGAVNIDPAASLYKFSCADHLHADFWVIDTPAAMKLLLSDMEGNIGPACRANNAYQTDFKRVSTVKTGKALLDGDKWKILEKAVIRYE